MSCITDNDKKPKQPQNISYKSVKLCLLLKCKFYLVSEYCQTTDPRDIVLRNTTVYSMMCSIQSKYV